MSRRRRLGRIGETFAATPSDYRVENPSLFPAWVWMRPPDAYDAPRKRGGPLFAEMDRLGFRVQVIPQTTAVHNVAIWRPWTYIVCSLPSGDFTETAESVDDAPCSVIMDCHFPIMNMEQAIGDDEQLIHIIDNKESLLANLALADAVTVPQAGWAADLAAVNPNVFLLPDYTDATADRFGVRLAEVAQASANIKKARQAARREMGL